MREVGEVARLRDGVDLGGRVGVRAHPRGGVGEDDVDLAELGGERVDGAGVADVEDAALDAGAGPRHGGRGGADALGVAAGEQDAVLRAHAGGERLHERAAETLVGPGDEGGAGASCLQRYGRRPVMSEATIEHTLPCNIRMAWTSPRPACGCCARWRSPGSFSAAARALGYTQSAVSRQVAALEAVAGRRALRAPAATASR